jgi:response regulator RpfG family c-di-GMP phosphodiesterase
MTQTPDRILLVDDDQSLLDAFMRTHRNSFNMSIACGPEEGLSAIEREGPFAVVVSDYQMPGMNGIEFLRQVEAVAPDSVRVMLTGNADMQSAIDAVNEGHVFRFLTKPCEAQTFAQCLRDALHQAHLRHAEQMLLERTVRGSVEVLADVLALANPEAFGRSTRILGYVSQLTKGLGLPKAWQVETAALLSQIGFITIPTDVIERMADGGILSKEYKEMIDRHPEVAHGLLSKIPRLEVVADMIANQQLAYEDLKSGQLEHATALGSQVLSAALAFDELVSIGAGREEAIRAMRQRHGMFAPRLLGLLSKVKLPGQDLEVRTVLVRSLAVDMTLDQDVRSTDGALIVAKGNVISESMLERLRNYAHADSIPQRIRVRQSDEEGELEDVAA